MAICAIESTLVSAGSNGPCRIATSSGCSTGWSFPTPSCSRATSGKCSSAADSSTYLLYPLGMRPVVALLSDFGSKDHYAGTMKGVILGICPEVTLVDITHDVTAHDVLEGALQLAASFKYFP